MASPPSKHDVRLENLFDNDFDTKIRCIYLADEIEDYTISKVLKTVRYLESENDKFPITMYINSPGGSIDQMFCLYDAMLSCPCPIVTIGTGGIYSAAGLILAAGDWRMATEHSYFMAHEVSTVIAGSAGEVATQAKATERIRNRFWDLMAKHTVRSVANWKRGIGGKETWFDSDEMKRWGIIDEILYPGKSPINTTAKRAKRKWNK
jgi:ATP-dependent Clp protease protease subunit